MYLIIRLFICLLSVLFKVCGNPSSFTEKWIVQEVDHFNPSNTRTWQQRYFVNNNSYKQSPVGHAFLVLGGEGEITSEFSSNSVIEYAKQFGTLLFFLEHRYYGKSRPTNNTSVSNLKYLTSQQALADTASFIKAMNDIYGLSSDKNKWIAFGGSYSGSLAAWLRYKYPSLVKGAVASSAPLVAKLDFSDFNKAIEQTIRIYSDECVNSIKFAIYQINEMLSYNTGQRKLTKMFNLCDSIERSVHNIKNIYNFYSVLADNFGIMIMFSTEIYNNGSVQSVSKIEEICNVMLDSKQGTHAERLASIHIKYDMYQGENCLEIRYNKTLEKYKDESWEAADRYTVSRPWVYQCCSEFGFLSGSYSSEMFGNFPLQFSIQQCSDIFGPQFDEKYIHRAVEETNAFYGGLNPNMTNVVFVQGSNDPWRLLGITKSLNIQSPVINIEGTAHCAIFDADNDLPQLQKARSELAKIIYSWLYY